MTDVDVQIACDGSSVPDAEQIALWAQAALAERLQDGELTVRVVDECEGAELNARYRGIARATNVLSFPFEAPPGAQLSLLGDIVICAPVLAREAREQDKEPDAHWAHIVIHGALHLVGYDHQETEQAEQMEDVEREVLKRLGYPDPYREAASA